MGLWSTGVGIWYNDHGRALPTVRIIVPSSRMVSVRPNTIAQSISDQYVIVLYPLTERAMTKWYLAVMRIHWVLYEIHFTTTQIRPGFYMYTLERSFCLIVNIMIDIRHISRCVIQISSQSGLYYMRLRQTISLAPYMSRIYHQLRPKKTRGPDVAPSVSRLIFMRCHDNVQSVTFKSSPECRTDTTIRAGTVYIHQMSH